MRVRTFLAAAVAAFSLSCVAAHALDPPQPFADAGCMPAAEMRQQLVDVVNQDGGLSMEFDKGFQQAFGDVWRERVGQPSQSVSLDMVWLQLAAVVSEFDEKGCLLTLSNMSIAEFRDLFKTTIERRHKADPPVRGQPVSFRVRAGPD